MILILIMNIVLLLKTDSFTSPKNGGNERKSGYVQCVKAIWPNVPEHTMFIEIYITDWTDLGTFTSEQTEQTEQTIYERTNVPYSLQHTWTLFHQPQKLAFFFCFKQGWTFRLLLPQLLNTLWFHPKNCKKRLRKRKIMPKCQKNVTTSFWVCKYPKGAWNTKQRSTRN